MVDARFAAAIADAAQHIPAAARFCVGGEIPGFRPWSDLQQESPEPLSNPLCGDVMLYTSGTTGRPKGVRRPFLPDQPPPTIIGRAGMAMIETFLPRVPREADPYNPSVLPQRHPKLTRAL